MGTTYGVVGMNCSHCVAAITDEIGRLPGVRDVTVELVEGGTSGIHVRSDVALDTKLVSRAVDEAGYALATGAP
jgi:copper chaperone CopZ